MIVVWTYDNSENNFGINHNFEKYLKESCYEHFFFKYRLIVAFVRGYYRICQAVLGNKGLKFGINHKFEGINT